MTDQEVAIDITHIPFSRYGAYVSVTHERGQRELIVHNVRRRFEEGPMYSVSFSARGDRETVEFENFQMDSKREFSVSAVPEKIVVCCGAGKACLYLRDDRTLVIGSENVDVHIALYRQNGYGTEDGEQRFRIIAPDQKAYTTFYVQEGDGILDGPYEKYGSCPHAVNMKNHLLLRRGSDSGRVLAAMRISPMEPEEIKGPICPEEDLQEIREEWAGFLSLLPEEPPENGTERKNTAEREYADNRAAEKNAAEKSESVYQYSLLTWYNLWSCFARAEDVYRYDTMLMSKKRMSAVWSWDHCFNALAMAKVSKSSAMEQFIAPFLLQTEKGVLPDMWNPRAETMWGITKPPIHGWCFAKLMDQFEFESEELITVFHYLEKWTNWWMLCSDTDHDGVPEYPQGCDSGWDNSTVFDRGFFMNAPDLPAYLILQMKTLERIAEELTQRAESSMDSSVEADRAQYWNTQCISWNRAAAELTERFYSRSWNGDRFVAKKSGTEEYEEKQTSLLTMMPLVLGKFLDQEKREKLVKILVADFLTEHGLATEMPSSEKYEADGYWRGPIWAPITYLLVDGLRRGGYTELAEDIALRYCRMSREQAKGNYENFDALTGRGLRAPGYTWSASVYMLLHWEYER